MPIRSLENAKSVLENTKNMNMDPNEVKELRRLALNKSSIHIVNITNTVHALAQTFDSEAEMAYQIERSNVKVTLLK